MRPTLALAARGLAAALLLALGLAAPLAAQGVARTTLRVSTAAGLLAALDDHRTIILAPGDYLLSEVYGASGPKLRWYGSEVGKELALVGLQDVEIRGEAGARLVADSPTVYVLDLYNCSGFRLKGLTLARGDAAGDEVSGGGLYVEGCADLVLDGVSLEGRSGYPLEVRDSTDLRVLDSRLRGGFYGALYLAGSRGVSLEASRIEGNSGDPLISVEESAEIAFSATTFSANTGGTFLGVYADKTPATGLSFKACTFSGNRFTYFTEEGVAVAVEAPRFEDNSFGPDWATAALAPPAASGEGSEESFTTHVLPGSGLGLSVPDAWTLQESPVPSGSPGSGTRVGVFAPDGQAFCVLLPLGLSAADLAAPGGADRALAVVSAIMKGEARTDLSLKAEAVPPGQAGKAGAGLAYRGLASEPKGATAAVRLRVQATSSGVYALLALAAAEEAFGPGSELAAILDSFGTP